MRQALHQLAGLRARFPRLITCNLSGYGEAGLLHELKAYDLLVQAESGRVAVSGAPGPAPAPVRPGSTRGHARRSPSVVNDRSGRTVPNPWAPYGHASRAGMIAIQSRFRASLCCKEIIMVGPRRAFVVSLSLLALSFPALAHHGCAGK